MASVVLKSSFATLNQYEAFYTGGQVQASFNGEHLLCLCRTKVNALNIKSGNVDHVFTQDEDVDMTCFILSPNDKYLVTSNQLMQLKQWDWKLKKVIRTWKSENKCPVTCMAFDQTSTLLATGNADSTIKVWDADRQYCTNNLRGHQGVVSVVQFHPDSSKCQLFTAADDYKIRLWDLESQICLAELSGHFSVITSIQCTVDCTSMYSSSRDGSVFVWNLTTYKKKTISVYESIESLILLPKDDCNPIVNLEAEDDYFVTAGKTGVLKVWSTNKMASVFQLPENEKSLSDANNLKDSSESNEHGFIYMEHIKALDMILTVTYDNNILLYNRKDFNLVKQFAGNNDEVYCIKFVGSDDSHIVVATNSSAVKVFDVSNWSCQILTGHTDIVLTLDTCHLDGLTHLVTGAKDNTIRLWTMDEKTKLFDCKAVGKGHSNNVGAVAFLKSVATFVVSAANDTTIKLWRYDEEKGKLRVKLTSADTHTKDINAISVSPKDQFIATGSQDKTAKLWNTSSLSCVAVLTGHSKGVCCVQFSPVEQILATSSGDSTIKFWELKTFKCVRTFQGHEGSILSFHFLSRGMQLISSGADGLLKLWSVRTSECLKTYDEHEDKVWTVTVNKSEDRLVTGGGDSKIVFWKDTTEEEKQQEITKNQEFIYNEQKLQNLLQKKKYGKALLLTITLEQPYRALTIMKDMWRSPTRREDLTSAIGNMRPDQIQTLLQFVVAWNTNAKHCHIAQAVQSIIFQQFSPDELLEFPDIRRTVEDLLPYTERHYNRLKELEVKSEIINYSCQLMELLSPMETEFMLTDSVL